MADADEQPIEPRGPLPRDVAGELELELARLVGASNAEQDRALARWLLARLDAGDRAAFARFAVALVTSSRSSALRLAGEIFVASMRG